MPKNKKNTKAAVTTTNTVETAPKASEKGKEVAAPVATPTPPAPPPPVSPSSSPVSGSGKPVFFPLTFLKSSPLKAEDLKVGESYILVKCIQNSPEGHFPTADRNIVTDIAIEAKFMRWTECYALPGGHGLTVEEFLKADEKTRASIQASHKLVKMGDFDDGRLGFADSTWSTVSEADIGLLVYPNNEEGIQEATRTATLMSARAFYLGWQQIIRALQRETLIRSANVTELFAWLDKQGMGTLRSAAACYGLNVKSTFAKDVDLAKAREVVKAARETIGKDPKQVERLAKEYTEKRAEWEKEKANLASHPTVTAFLRYMEHCGVTGDLGLAQHPFEFEAAKAAEKAKEDARKPKDTAINNGTSAPRRGKSNIPSIDEMRKLIAVADAQEAARKEAEAKAAAEYAAKVAADEAKKKMAEAEAAKAAQANVTSTKASPAVTQPKVKSKKAKLALFKSG